MPDDVVEALGAGKRPAVRVTIGAHTYRSTIASRGGVYLLPLSAENRAGAGVAAGDEVDVTVELDTEPREVAVPDDLATALAGDAAADERVRGAAVQPPAAARAGDRGREGPRDPPAADRQGPRDAPRGRDASGVSGIGDGSRRGAPTALRVILAR